MDAARGLERSLVRRQILLINAAHCLTHYALLVLPTAVLTMAHPDSAFGADYGSIIVLATGMFVLYGAGSLPQAWLAARFGRKALMTIFFFGMGLSLIAAGTTATPLGLVLTLALAGLFAAIYHPIGTAMLVDSAGNRPGRALGVNGVFGNLGVALAPVVTALLAQHSWRAAFVVPGAACVALGLVWRRVPIHDHGTMPRARPFPAIPAEAVRRASAVLLIIAVVSGLVFNAFTLLIPKLMQERLASAPHLLPVVGALAFAVTMCGALTQFVLGRLIDRITLKRVFLPLAFLMASGLVGLAVAPGWLVLPLTAAVAVAVFGQVLVNETMTARYFVPALRLRMYSLRFFLGFLGSSVAAPLVGLLHQSTGELTVVTLALAAVASITVACALYFPDRPDELSPELAPAPA